MQLYRWIYLEGNVSGGLSVFCDPVDPFQGRSRVFNGGFRLQPNGRLQQSLFWNRVAFNDAATGLRVYTVHIVNARTTYQFTRALSVRGIAQCNGQPARARMLQAGAGCFSRPHTCTGSDFLTTTEDLRT